MNDFDWTTDIKPMELYIIDSEAYNELSKIGGKMNSDEWVLFEVVDRDEENVYYKVQHYNLYPNTEWITFDDDKVNPVPIIHMNNLIESGYWKAVKEIPKYTLFEHENNKFI